MFFRKLAARWVRVGRTRSKYGGWRGLTMETFQFLYLALWQIHFVQDSSCFNWNSVPCTNNKCFGTGFDYLRFKHCKRLLKCMWCSFLKTRCCVLCIQNGSHWWQMICSWCDVFGDILIPLTSEYAVSDVLLVAETSPLKQWISVVMIIVNVNDWLWIISKETVTCGKFVGLNLDTVICSCYWITAEIKGHDLWLHFCFSILHFHILRIMLLFAWVLSEFFFYIC